MSIYASGTNVSSDRSEAEIRRTLTRYDADDIVIGQSARQQRILVQFHYRDMPLQAMIPLPDLNDERFWLTPSGKKRRERDAAVRELKKETRQQWRVLLLLLKAKLEAVENQISDPRQEFLPWLMLPTGQTVGEMIGPQVEQLITGGQLPKLLMEGKQG